MKETRWYGLFEKRNGKWIRVFAGLSARKSLAVSMFQSALIAGAMGGPERCLRPVKRPGWLTEPVNSADVFAENAAGEP